MPVTSSAYQKKAMCMRYTPKLPPAKVERILSLRWVENTRSHRTCLAKTNTDTDMEREEGQAVHRATENNTLTTGVPLKKSWTDSTPGGWQQTRQHRHRSRPGRRSPPQGAREPVHSRKKWPLRRRRTATTHTSHRTPSECPVLSTPARCKTTPSHTGFSHHTIRQQRPTAESATSRIKSK